MIEIGVFHNGASDLPVKITADGVAINEGDLRATQESAARVQVIGEVEELLATHKVLTGPPRDHVAGADVISATHTDRQSTLFVRITGELAHT